MTSQLADDGCQGARPWLSGNGGNQKVENNGEVENKKNVHSQ